MEPAGSSHRAVVYYGDHTRRNRPERLPSHQPYDHTHHESPEDNTRCSLLDTHTHNTHGHKEWLMSADVLRCFSAEAAKDGHRDESSAGHSDAGSASGKMLLPEHMCFELLSWCPDLMKAACCVNAEEAFTLL